MAISFQNKVYFSNGFFSKNPMLLTVTTDNLLVSGVRRPNFSIVIKNSTISFPGTSTVVDIPELSLIPDDDGNATIDLSKLVDSILEDYAKTMLTEKFPELSVLSYGDVEVFILAQERYGTPPAYVGSANSFTRNVSWGAINAQDDSDNWTLMAAIDTYVDTSMYMTNIAQYAQLGFEQPQYINYYHNKTGSIGLGIKPEFKVILHDGTEGLWNPTTAYSTVPISAFGRASFQFTPKDLGLNNTVRILSVRIITEGGTPQSDWMNFTVNHDKLECEKLFLYINQFGCPETLLARGRHATSVEFARTIGVTEVSAMQKALYTGKKQRDVSLSKIQTMRSGYITKDELQQYLDLLKSNQVFELTAFVGSGEKGPGTVYSYTAITLITDKFKVTECGQYLHAFECDYQYSYPLTTLDEPVQILTEDSTIPDFKAQDTADTTTYSYLN